MNSTQGTVVFLNVHFFDPREQTLSVSHSLASVAGAGDREADTPKKPKAASASCCVMIISSSKLSSFFHRHLQGMSFVSPFRPEHQVIPLGLPGSRLPICWYRSCLEALPDDIRSGCSSQFLFLSCICPVSSFLVVALFRRSVRAPQHILLHITETTSPLLHSAFKRPRSTVILLAWQCHGCASFFLIQNYSPSEAGISSWAPFWTSSTKRTSEIGRDARKTP
jgi:hypothetical protein